MTSPPPLPVEHWNFQVDSPFRAPAEIRELASTAQRDGVDLPSGVGGSWAEMGDVFGEDLALAEDQFEAYDELEATEADEAGVFEDEALANYVAEASSEDAEESFDAVTLEQQQVTGPPGEYALRTGQAARWVRIVDGRVRALFHPSGPGLAGRVHFLDRAGFAARFPRDDLVPVLVNLFSLPVADRAGTPIESILRHHHMADLLEPLRDEKLVVRRLTALRTFIRERIKAGAFLQSSPFGDVRHRPRGLVAQLIEGWTTGEASPSARHIFVNMPAHVEVLVHEACHFYAARAFNEAIRNRARDRVFVGMRLSEILREGMAEFFAREVMRVNAATLGPIRTDAYQGYVEAAWRFIQTAGEQHARAAYFDGSGAAINRLFRAIDLNIRDYPLMVPAFMLSLLEQEELDGTDSETLHEAGTAPYGEAQSLEAKESGREDPEVQWESDREGETGTEREDFGTDGAEEEEEAEESWELEEYEADELESNGLQGERTGDPSETEYEAEWELGAGQLAPAKPALARTSSPLTAKSRLAGRRPVTAAAKPREVPELYEADLGEAQIAIPLMLLEKPTARPDLGVTASQVGAYDSAFKKAVGARFKALVEWAAKEVDMNPGLVAENLIAEARRDTYLTKGRVSTYQVGADDFYTKRHDIAAKVPAFKKIGWDQASKRSHINDKKGKPRTVTTVDFNSGRDALLGNAVYVKHGEAVLRAAAKAAGKDYDALPVEVRFALVRLACNAGHGRALKNLADVFKGGEVLIRKPQKDAGPQRRATIHAARAMHLSSSVFGVTPR